MNRFNPIRFSSLVAAVLIVSLAHDAQARQDVMKEQFSVREGGTLHLDVDYGDIEVETHGRDEVLITLERDVDRASDSEKKEIYARQEIIFDKDGNDVIVEIRFDEDDVDRAWKRWKRDYDLEVDLTITIPERYNVEFRTGAGNVIIAEAEGDISGRTGAGNIEIEGVFGTLDISSGAGNITIDGAEGDVYVQSGAGGVELEDVQGRIEARTGAGNITAVITGPLAGDSSFDTGAGNVTVYLADDVEADVEGRASLGNAKSDFDLRVRGKFMSKSFSGRINGGGPEITLSSGVGNVSLRRN